MWVPKGNIQRCKDFRFLCLARPVCIRIPGAPVATSKRGIFGNTNNRLLHKSFSERSEALKHVSSSPPLLFQNVKGRQLIRSNRLYSPRVHQKQCLLFVIHGGAIVPELCFGFEANNTGRERSGSAHKELFAAEASEKNEAPQGFRLFARLKE